MQWLTKLKNVFFCRGRLLSSSAFFAFFSLVVVSFVFAATDKEYNLNQQIARGYITRDAIFFEPHDPSRIGAASVVVEVDFDDPDILLNNNVTVDEDGNLVFVLEQTPAEDEGYSLANWYTRSGETRIERFLSSGGDNYLASIHNGNTRGIFYKGKIVEPPIVEGRFFTEEECLLREPLAVIGNDYKKQTYVRDGDKYIEYEGREYKVIGVTAVASSSTLDHLIFINFGGMTIKDQITGRYYIDGIGSMEQVFNELDKASQEILDVKLDRLETPTTYIDVVSGGMYLKTYLKILLALMFTFIYISILVQIVKRQSVKIAVMSIYGISFKRRLLKVSGDTLTGALIGIFIGLITIIVIIYSGFFVLPFATLWKYVAILSCCSLLLVGIMVASLIIGMRRIDIGEVVRQV